MRRFTRLVAAPVVGLVLSLAPAADVLACSCAALSTPEELVTKSEVVFIGSVRDRAEAPPGELGGPTVAYAFEVERASEPTPAIMEVRAIGGDGGASCGIEFGIGERWLVAAYSGVDALETNLCSGNTFLDPEDPAAAVELVALLPSVPAPDAGDGASEAGAGVPVGVAAIAVVTGLLLIGSILAFRRDRPG
jgi:hypothetical protein